VPLDADGFFIERMAYVPVAASASSVATSSGGADWRGVAKTAAGAMLGGGGTFGVADSFMDGGESTPLGDAQPFEYIPDELSDDVTELAARGVSEAHEAECFANYESDMEQCQVARAMYQDPRTYALCIERAFSKFQTCRGY
jgi:hypothetical protein